MSRRGARTRRERRRRRCRAARLVGHWVLAVLLLLPLLIIQTVRRDA
ncbi:MAG: hypothetical protein RIB84_22425 [Sneathiellaceae bacterium]